MGGIRVSAFMVFIPPPGRPLRFTEHTAQQFMDISTLTVNYFTEQTFLYHVHCQDLKEIVTAIFQLHAMFLCSLRSLYQLPAIFQCSSCRNFHCHMLSAFHGIDSDRCMPFPGSGYINQIDIILFTQLFPAVIISEIFFCRTAVKALKCFLISFYSTFIQIT